MPDRPLTPKQAMFVAEYLVDLNAAAAARRAGYSPRTADRIGHELLKKPEVAAAVAAAQAERSARTEVTADRVLRELAAVAFSDIGDVVDFAGEVPRLRRSAEIPERARRALSSVKVRRVVEGDDDGRVDVDLVEIKLWDKVSALEKLGRHLGMFRDAVDVNVRGGLGLTLEQAVAADAELEAWERERRAGRGEAAAGGQEVPAEPPLLS